ncbi:tRNA 2-thiouridine(34) synthase MnmA [Candidatus Saccharibacteria bacterium]|nr:tRNA 2-thiouridine(34) synthase MnmA [Candidatus Saccharibacteria bacterium]
MSKTVYLGMSGGVDSSVSALLLKEQGYHVVGVYMKNWSKSLPGAKCPWAEDLADSKRVATHLGLDFHVFDFEKPYFDRVVTYMIDEYQKGHTPNPDIWCNQEIKFNLFLDTCLAHGADLIATGHYAKTEDGRLYRAKDDKKDQTYFLSRVTAGALQKTLFPLGDLTKSEVKALAKKHGLHVAQKPESMGICFIGEVGIREFLSQYITAEPGDVIDQETNVKIGTHDGAVFYTIGQRHGFHASSNLPYYVVKKDIKNNRIVVSQNLASPTLWYKSIELRDLHWIDDTTDQTGQPTELQARIRHQAPLIPATLTDTTLTFTTEQRGLAQGQTIAFYNDGQCLGSGIIS